MIYQCLSFVKKSNKYVFIKPLSSIKSLKNQKIEKLFNNYLIVTFADFEQFTGIINVSCPLKRNGTR